MEVKQEIGEDAEEETEQIQEPEKQNLISNNQAKTEAASYTGEILKVHHISHSITI